MESCSQTAQSGRDEGQRKMVKKLVSSLASKKKKLISSLCEKLKKERRDKKRAESYERLRARTIRENLEKMRALGIKVKSPSTTKLPLVKAKTIKKKKLTHFHPSMPRRTSSRLAKKNALMDEIAIGGKVKAGEDDRREVYTCEHEKLLRDCKTPWSPLFDADFGSKRFYDSVNGTTCHQCRQKTLGLRTECNHCHLPHGRLCGNCLYIRYGENLLEAKENGSWSCPMCRGICNCSRCRYQNGLPPTGPIHLQACKLGFKSVAHYLIHTRRAN